MSSITTQFPIVNRALGALERISTRIRRDFYEIPHLKSPANRLKFAETSAKFVLNIVSESLNEDLVLQDIDADKKHWLINPISGKINLFHGIPSFCVTLSWCDMGVPKVTVIYDPIQHEMFWATSGFGLFINQRKIYPVRQSGLSHSLIHTKTHIPGVSTLWTGSTHLAAAYLSAGKLDACIQDKCNFDPALQLMIEESGAKCFELESKPNHSLVFAEEDLANRLADHLQLKIIHHTLKR